MVSKVAHPASDCTQPWLSSVKVMQTGWAAWPLTLQAKGPSVDGSLISLPGYRSKVCKQLQDINMMLCMKESVPVHSSTFEI